MVEEVKVNPVKNVDDLIVKDNQERLEGKTPGSTEPYKPDIQRDQDESDSIEATIDSQESTEDEKEEELPQKEEKIDESLENNEKNTDKDEYGNEITKKKMYTEEEVNELIRDRMSRGRHAQNQQQTQQVQQAAQDFKSDPNSPDSWEIQLEQFIESTLQKREQKYKQDEFQRREQSIQADFETKFSRGMERYKDFYNVVGHQPITDSMLLATRGMTDPAAFVYAASKNHPKELERIAQIQDPYQQGMEIGKLEERMRKVKNVTSATRPLSKVTSDTGVKQEHQPSMDDKIRQYGRQKFNR